MSGKKRVVMGSKSTGMIDDLLDSMRKNLGGLSPEEAKEKARGVLIPTYAERYARDSNVYFVEKIEMYAGGYGSGKSSYGFHVGCAFVDAGGLFVIIDTENKTSMKTVESNMGKHRIDTGRVWLIQTGTMYNAAPDKKDKKKSAEDEVKETIDSWQAKLKELLTAFKEKNLGIPIYVLVDSMLGAAGAEAFAALEATGEIQGRSSIAIAQAASLATYFKALTGLMLGVPVLVAFTNQANQKISMDGKPVYGDGLSIPGGEKPKLASHLMLHFIRGGSEETTSEAGREVIIKVRKNSFGGEERSIRVSFAYDHLKDEAGEVMLDSEGHPIRVVNWDWTEATGKLLAASFVEKDHLNAEARKSFIITSPRAKRFNCPQLNLTDADFVELGRAFESNPEVMALVERIPKMGTQYFNVIAGVQPDAE
jgi:RecA/RadA recombinase